MNTSEHMLFEVGGELFGEIFRQSQLGQAVVDRGGRFLEVNTVVCDILGSDAATLTAQSFSDYSDLDIAELAGTARRNTVETQVRRPDGTIREVHVAATHLVLDGGDKRLFVVTIDDVGENSLFNRSAAREHALAAFGDIHFHLSADGRYLGVHAPDESALAVAPELLLGRTIQDVLPDDVATRTLAAVRHVAELGVATAIEYELTVAEGERRHFEARLAPLPNGEVLAAVRDITDRVDLEKRLVHAGKMESLGSLASGLAHDFNNVLAAVDGQLEFLTRNEELGTDAQRRIALVLGATERARSLIANLMALSRPVDVTPEHLNVDAFVTELSDTIERLMGEDIHLEMDLTAGDVGVLIDRSGFESVMLNMVSNAREAMPSGGRFRIMTETDGDWLAVTMADDGVGMDAATQQRIFEPFFSTRRHGVGTGLGLATSYSTLSQAGGTITVDSAHDEGTTFTLRLPITTPHLPRPAPVTDPPSGAPAGNGETVLILEDDALVLETTADVLRGSGYKVLVALDADEALELADAHGPVDVLLSDVVLGGQSAGPETAKLLQQRQPQLRVLFMSGYAPDRYNARSVMDEATMLRKPFSHDELLNRISELLSTR